jgi:hypothetical protein
MKKLSVFLFLIASFVLIPVQSKANNSIFERLAGNWQGTGVVSGMDSQITMNWESVLAGKFYRLSFRNNMKGKNGPVVFEGTAFYQAKTASQTEGSWFDSFGSIRPIKALIETDKLTANWGNPETEEGQTIYRLVDANKLEVVDSVKTKDGAWREFGHSVFTKTRD